MPVFHYQATDDSGRVSSGEINAENAAAAREQLFSHGLTVTSLQEIASATTAISAMPLSATEQSQLVQQVSDLVTAQVPLSIGLRALSEEVPTARLRQVLMGMSDDLEAGVSIEQVFERWSASLPTFLTGMIRASSRAGALGAGLNQFAVFTKHRAQARRNLLVALLYPVVLGLVSALLAVLLLGYIVPKFKSIFEGFGMELPGVTAVLLGMSDLVVRGWFVLLLIPVLMFLGLRALMQNAGVMQILYYVPFYGPMLRYRGLSEFALLLEMMIRNGVRLPEALQLAGDGVCDANIAEGAFRLVPLVKQGLSLADAVSSLPNFNREFVYVVSVGRGESEMCESLRMSSERFNALSSLRLRFFGLAMEPLMVTGLGCAVGFVVIALFMPLVKLLNDLS